MSGCRTAWPWPAGFLIFHYAVKKWIAAPLQLWLALPVLLLMEYGSRKVLGPNRIGLRKHLDGLPLWVFIAVVCLGIGPAVFVKQVMPHLVGLQVLAALVCVFGIFELTDKSIYRTEYLERQQAARG